MNERRIARLQELIKVRAAEVIDQELSDPRRGMITVTKVELDREMVACKIYWSVLGSDTQRRTSERMLDSARGYVQREIGAVLSTRTVPRISFIFDESIAGAIRIQELLEEIRTERGDDGEDQPDEAQPPHGDDDEEQPTG